MSGFVIWFTGLSGSGKSTLAERVCDYIRQEGLSVERLDGDTLRGIFKSTGFSRDERDEHIKRVGFMASLLEKHGVAVVASFISPYAETRGVVRRMCKNFIEVYVAASVEECCRRDVKGLYARAKAGQIENFTGIDDPYEAPTNADLVVDTEKQDIEESVKTIIEYLQRYI